MYPQDHLPSSPPLYSRGSSNGDYLVVSASHYPNSPQPRYGSRWKWAFLIIFGAGLASVYFAVQNGEIKTPWSAPQPWWIGGWRSDPDEQVSALDLGMRTVTYQGQRHVLIGGQLVKKYVDGYLVSLVITNGEARGNACLLYTSRCV